ncbi:MAG: hypothetical protein Q9213_003694 [Squamulea squamosa]
MPYLFELRPSPRDHSEMELFRITEPSTTSASLIRAAKWTDDGYFVSTQNFSIMVHHPLVYRFEEAKKDIQRTETARLRQHLSGLDQLKRLLEDKPMKALRIGGGHRDYGFSDLIPKLTLIERELELIEAVGWDFELLR